MTEGNLETVKSLIARYGRGCLRNRRRRDQFGLALSSAINQRIEIVQSFIDEMDGLDLYLDEDHTAFLEFCRLGL